MSIINRCRTSNTRSTSRTPGSPGSLSHVPAYFSAAVSPKYGDMVRWALVLPLLSAIAAAQWAASPPDRSGPYHQAMKQSSGQKDSSLASSVPELDTSLAVLYISILNDSYTGHGEQEELR